MKTQEPKPGDIVIVPDGTTGEVIKIEISGELKIKVGDEYYYHFPEDVEVIGHIVED